MATRTTGGVLLTTQSVDREYLTAGKRLRDIQADTGFGRTTLDRYAKHAGIPLIDVTAYNHIDPAWLANQYTNQRRSFPDIATELRMTETTVAAAARRYRIPSRPPGIASHPDIITKLDQAIAVDIRRAVEGQLRGWQRLRRFEQVMAYTSLNAACPNIDAHISALTTQFRRLERDIGGQLFHRATPTDPMRPTKRGEVLLNELRRPDVHALIERHDKPPRRNDKPMRRTAPTNR